MRQASKGRNAATKIEHEPSALRICRRRSLSASCEATGMHSAIISLKKETSMQALVLERKGELSLRDIELPANVGPRDVKIAIHTVGVCGSDVHYYTHGRIGPYVVNAPMVLGHEAAGTIIEIGAEVSGLKVGDRVCMEPGVPDLTSRASKLGIYN